MEAWSSQGSDAFAKLTRPWQQHAAKFRAEGFYERFPAKGQVERVRRIHLELTRELGMEPEDKEEAE
jgi:hypothetical protein